MKPRLLFALLISLLAVAAASAPVVLHGSRAGSEREGEGEHESVADMGRELQEPADALMARELLGSDPGVDYSRAYAKAAAQGNALGRTAQRRDPRAAGAQWRFDGPTDIGGRRLDVAIDPQHAEPIL